MTDLHALTGGLDHPVSASLPVAVFLHGYGSDEKDLTALAPWLPDGTPWVSLRAPLPVAHGGNAWFAITTPGDPDPAPVAAATAAIWGWIDTHLSEKTSVVPIGFSQGGLMATQLLRTRPERVAAAVVLGGFIQSAQQPGDSALAASRPPLFWGRGGQDTVITAAAVTRTQDWLPRHSMLTERVYPRLGHSIDVNELADMRQFLTEHSPNVAREGESLAS